MREESERLLKQARENRASAATLLQGDRFEASMFYSNQTAELALKAVYLEKKRRPARTHDLVVLSRELGAPKAIQEAARILTPSYIITRYPDAANGVPAELFSEDDAKKQITLADEVLKWVELKLT